MNIIIGDKIAKIDKQDMPIYLSRKWHISSTGYLVWRGYIDGKKKTIRLHRLINKTPEGYVTDHINNDKLDNRRKNLRTVTQKENMRNMTNQGKGYWYQKQNKNWVVEVYGIHRGCFNTEEEAESFAELVRRGKADKKPKEVRTHCKNGHSLENAYVYNNIKYCRICQSERSRKYYDKAKSRNEGGRPSDSKVAKNNANALWRHY